MATACNSLAGLLNPREHLAETEGISLGTRYKVKKKKDERRVDVDFSTVAAEGRKEISEEAVGFSVHGPNPSLLLFRLIFKSPNCPRVRHTQMLLIQRFRN